MSALTWCKKILSRSPRKHKPVRKTHRRLEVETLEDRVVPANIFVHNPTDGAGALPLVFLGGNAFLAPNLRSAVVHAQGFAGASTIWLDSTTYHLNNNAAAGGGELEIKFAPATSLTIRNLYGQVTTIDAAPTGALAPSRIFEVDAGGTATLDHLRLIDGKATDAAPNGAEGGAILNHAATVGSQPGLTLTYDQLGAHTAILNLGNTAQGDDHSGNNGRGGGIYNDAGASLSMSFSTVDSNTAHGSNVNSSLDESGPGDGDGGGLFIDRDSAAISITSSTFSNNQAVGGNDLNSSPSTGFGGNGNGGGICSFEELDPPAVSIMLVNSTFASNIARGGNAYGGGDAAGGGVNIGTTGAFVFVNDTIAINQAIAGTPVFGSPGSATTGGVFVFFAGAPPKIVNTIIAKNTSDSGGGPTPDDVNGTFVSLGHNFIGDADGSFGFTGPGDQTGSTATPIDPAFASIVFGGTPILTNNGGPTQTIALLAYSNAINMGDNGVSPTPPLVTSPLLTTINTGVPPGFQVKPLVYDQRGPNFLRKVNGTVDIGAFEFQMNLDKFYVFHSNRFFSVTSFVPAPGVLLGSAAFPLPSHAPPLFYTTFVDPSSPPLPPGTSLLLLSNGSFFFTVPPGFVGTVHFRFGLTVIDGAGLVLPTNLVFTATIQVIPGGFGRGSAGDYMPFLFWFGQIPFFSTGHGG